MKKAVIIFLSIIFLSALVMPLFAEDPSDEIGSSVEKDYMDLIDQHVKELSSEYNISTETESLLVQRAAKSYIIADLVDYTLLIFMAKYNVATGGIDMKKANAEVISSLKELSNSANAQMLANLNMLRSIKKMSAVTVEAEAQ